jgi:hypothetical protein
LDDLFKNLQTLSSALNKLGWVKQAREVDFITSRVLLHTAATQSNRENVENQRKALLIKARSLIREIQEELGDDYQRAHTLALISYELSNEIGA